MKFYQFVVLFSFIVPSSIGGDATSHGRELSFPKIWVYTPRSLVTDHVVIDQDLDEIKRQLSLGTSTSYTFAERLYKEGTQSRATAVIALDRPLDRAMAKGSIIHGLASTVPGFPEPQHVFGQLHDAAESGDTTLWIAYDSNTVEKSDIHCQDDVNPTSYCNSFLTSTGNINFPALNVSYAYSYNMTTDNIKDRTIQGLSTNADKWMRKCQKCPRRHFRKFRRFYGRADYADEIVNAALYGRKTDLANGNMNLGEYKVKGRIEIAKKGMTLLNVWMWIIWQMEHAIEICEKECYQSESTTCESSDAVHAWDAAVAYYMGTHRPDDINTGMMMFHATERRCRTFRTCGEQGNQTSGAAYVNQLVFKNFIIGQRKIIRGDCNGARNAKEIIVNRMSIPLVQGAIQHAYSAASSVAYDEKSSAEASAFTFSILPIVHECNEEDALLIHRELNAKKDSTIDFQAVKSAFERNYQCMNIQCDDVGGIYDHLLDNYKFGAEPCKASAPTSEPTTSHSEKESSRVKGITMGGVSIGVATLIAFLVIIVGAMIATKDVKAIEDAPIESEDPIKGDSGSTLMFA